MKELSIEEKAKCYDNVRDKIAIRFGSNVAKEIFSEYEESEDERIRKEMIEIIKNEAHEFPASVIAEKSNSWIAWLEKQGEQKQDVNMQIEPSEYINDMGGNGCYLKNTSQKPADKVESKFHEGDWLTAGLRIRKIIAVGTGLYVVEREDGTEVSLSVNYVESYYHLWTVEDAKEGDVLVASGCIFIFEKFLPKDGGVSYCHYDYVSSTPQFDFTKDYNWYFGKEAEVYPATREQRDFLFKKMKEAGYEWDVEKKELKKIEQNQVINYPDSLPKDNWELIHEFVNKFGRIPKDEDELNVLIEYVLKRQNPTAWSEEDEKEVAVLEAYIHSKDWSDSHIDRALDIVDELVKKLKSLKDKVQPQLKQEWSEEDKNMLQSILDEYKSMPTEKRNWLRTLKDRYTWKPSDEQIGVIEAVVNNRSFQRRHLDSLYADLKKLREE